MKKNFVKICLLLIVCGLFAGCKSLNHLSKGVAEKDLTASGTFAYNRVGLNQQTQTPEVLSLFVVGDYSSHTGEGEQLRVDYTEDASIFNSNAVTKRYKMTFFSSDPARIDKLKSESERQIKELSTPK